MPEALDPILLALRLSRWLDLASSIAIFGALLFAAAIARPALLREAGAVSTAPRAYLFLCLALKLAATAIWLPAQAAQMGGKTPFDLDLIRLVAGDTVFGQALLGRTALATAAVLVAGDLRSPLRVAFACGLAAVALALQARLGHGVALDKPFAQLLLALHILAAGAWLGALPPLAWLVLRLPPERAAVAVRRFSWLGIAAVLVLAGSAYVLASLLVGGVGGWFGTVYGRVAIAKLCGFGLLLGLAAANKFLFTPRLLARGGGRWLAASIAIESGIGLAVIGLAAWLATVPPGVHLQPQWPFPLQPDLSGLDDSYIRKELWRAAALAGVVALALAALLRRATRWPGLVVTALLIVWLPAPNLRLLAKPASPTSFHVSETGFSASSIARGEDITKRHCTANCFTAKDDPTEPASYNLWGRSDGDLFGWLTEVFDRIGYSPFAHGTITGLSERERWMLIDYFRARVAAGLLRKRDDWRIAIPAPEIDIACTDGPSRLSELQGRVVELIANGRGAPAPSAAPSMAKAVRVILDESGDAAPGPGTCVSASRDGWTAYAVLAGLGSEQLGGTVFLIDTEGWLRFRYRPGSGAERSKEIAAIFAKPFDASMRPAHRH
ncbi:hypothetical protein ASE63_23370 [Bosea sp. Root381]|uniref:copper resistance D family protein n=1 Tax=Bosea sp. Root381 TaxID=1736524 RepID=UPI0006F8CC5C|nr:CopD family protein [Bosea sp. Root381]KRE06900.1 hypothetical protein ASE63_23370 [Bosea sp. Root381]